jgi:hypothetical protein
VYHVTVKNGHLRQGVLRSTHFRDESAVRSNISRHGGSHEDDK